VLRIPTCGVKGVAVFTNKLDGDVWVSGLHVSPSATSHGDDVLLRPDYSKESACV